MICSLPVIVTDHCGYARYVKQARGGILCHEPFEQQKLNNILENFLADKAVRQQFSQNGFNYTQSADIYSMTDKAVQVILTRAKRNQANK